MVFLRLAPRRWPQVLRPQQRDRPLGGQKGQPAKHGPPDREAGGVSGAGAAIPIAGRRQRLGFIWRQRRHAEGRGTERAPRVGHGARTGLLRRDRRTLAAVYGPEGQGEPWTLTPNNSSANP